MTDTFGINSVLIFPRNWIARITWEEVDVTGVCGTTTLLTVQVLLVSLEKLKQGTGKTPLICCRVILVFKEANFWCPVPSGAYMARQASLLGLLIAFLYLLMDLLSDVFR